MVKIEPYILDPRLPASTYDTPSKYYDAIETTPYEKNTPPTKKFYYGSKFGGNLDAFDAKISTAATALGMPTFDWTSSGRVGATWNAHRLVLKAGQLDEQSASVSGQDSGACVKSLQVRLMDRFYQDFHANSKDMSDNSYLAGVAAELGLFDSEAAASKWLESDDLEYELGNKLQQAEMNGVQSIPFYIINVSRLTLSLKQSRALIRLQSHRRSLTADLALVGEQDGADHMSETGSHESFLRMMQMAVAPYVR